jgi:hypothetical protein
VIFSRHPRRRALYLANYLSAYPKSHRIISFADPHPLNPLESYRFKKHKGVGVCSFFKPSTIDDLCSSPFFSCTCALFGATGAPQLFWNQFVAHSFDHDGGVCTLLVLPPRFRMNCSMANFNGSNVSLRCPQHGSTRAHILPYSRFASHPCRFLVNYVDPILPRAGVREHIPLSTRGPRRKA